MSLRGLLLRAVVQWHIAGRMAAPKAGSVQMTQVLIDELLRARALIKEQTLRRDATITFDEPWLTEAMQFTMDTSIVEDANAR